MAVLLGTGADDVEGAVDSGEQQLARLAQDEGQGGIDDVGRRQAVVEPARLRPDLLGHRLRERQHVVVGAPLDLSRPVDVDARAGANRLDRLGRDDAELAPGVERGELDLEPRLQPPLVAPQRAEGRPGVAVDHSCSLRVGPGRRPRRQPGWTGAPDPWARILAAKIAALREPLTAMQPTGVPGGCCTIESRASMPPRSWLRIGTPITGSSV